MCLRKLWNAITLKGDDIAWLVPHQANKRIIDATARRMGVGIRKGNVEY